MYFRRVTVYELGELEKELTALAAWCNKKKEGIVFLAWNERFSAGRLNRYSISVYLIKKANSIKECT